jgi:hypothetical protein
MIDQIILRFYLCLTVAPGKPVGSEAYPFCKTEFPDRGNAVIRTRPVKFAACRYLFRQNFLVQVQRKV